VVLLVVISSVIGLLFFLGNRLVETPMGLLYSGLAPADSGKIVTRLEAANVPYELRAGGTQIFVPDDTVLRLRMTMAEAGLPRGGSVGYEIFDKPDSLGTTRSLQDINLLRALEGELARTIDTLAPISAARVHLVIPKRELFTRDREPPSASVVVTLGGGELSPSQVAAVRQLVASGVSGLKPSQVSIIDDSGRLLARGGNNPGSLAVTTGAAQEYRVSYEKRVKRMVEDILERSLGFGKVRAEVSAEIDFDRITTNNETFDPDSQVARSTQVVEEQLNSADGVKPDTVSVATDLPDAGKTDKGGTASTSATQRTEETTNFEISKTVRSQVRETGQVRRLSVAVLVDGTYTTDANGQRVYQPRGADELKKIETLVRSTIGYNEDRGDKVEVVNLPFAQVDAPKPTDQPMIALGKSDYFKIAEMAVLFVVGLLIVLMVLRPLATHALVPQPARPEGGDTPALPGPEQTASGQLAEVDDENMIDLDRIEGKVKESSLKKISEIVENHPEEALAIIRNWLYQQA